jgi:DNA-binding response OmpR family regulator
MTAERRRLLLRYGIGIDAVILVSGMAMAWGALPPALITALLLAAIALAAWHGGRGPALAAIVTAVLARVYLLDGPVTLAGLAALTLLGLLETAAIGLARRRTEGVRSKVESGAAKDVSLASEPLSTVGLTPSVSPSGFATVGEPDTRETFLPPHIEEVTDPAVIAAAGLAPVETDAAETDGVRSKVESGDAGDVSVASEPLSTLDLAPSEFAEDVAREQERRQHEDEQRLEAERREGESLAAARIESERIQTERLAAERIEAERLETERLETERLAARREFEERLMAEREHARLEAERLAEEALAEEARQAEQALTERLATERADLQRRLDQRMEAERREQEELERAANEKFENERRAAEQAVQERIAAERAELQRRLEERLAADRERLEREAAELALSHVATGPEQLEPVAAPLPAAGNADAAPAEGRPPALPKAAAPPATSSRPSSSPSPRQPAAGVMERLFGGAASLVSALSGNSPSRGVNLKTKGKPAAAPAPRPAAAPRRPVSRKPRLLLLERRRGMAETVIPKLRGRGVDIEIVERWIDAVDELYRFRPDALLLDLELADLARVHGSIVEQNPMLPIFLTGRSATAGNEVPLARAGFVARPYDPEELIRLAERIVKERGSLFNTLPGKNAKLAPSFRPADPPPAATPKVAPSAASTAATDEEAPASLPAAALTPRNAGNAGEPYEVSCFHCRVRYDAMDADWCSCLVKDRSLVCTNCLSCFCKAPASYKEKFWIEAPPRLFERKTAGRRHQRGARNAAPAEVTRPLILLVEDDEDIQVIVQRVASNLGYGIVVAPNGQDGLTMARLYEPDLILSDAFMPKLDGREMCRMLRDEPVGQNCRMIIMTGLYTDTKYKSEALKRFKIDDYIAKPVAITDLIALFQKHLEVVRGTEEEQAAPQSAPETGGEGGISIAEMFNRERALVDNPSVDDSNDEAPALQYLSEEPMDLAIHPAQAARSADRYEVCCFSCSELFDATNAEWCSCLGRDQTLVCDHCSQCFCKAPSLYKERFWMEAPSTLFERKTIGSKRNTAPLQNPPAGLVKRPLILLVEDDENIQLIVRTVVTTLGYGFIVAADGQEGLQLAQEYHPELILSDAFMPKLDGREMCRLLKENPLTAASKAIIMTGLYTDRKYKNEAFSYFKVDDYVAKPLAVDDLMGLLKKHLPQDVQPTM